jgi:mono/diheme cytochrome c family protein
MDMSRTTASLALIVCVPVAVLFSRAAAQEQRYPEETAAYRRSALPGYALVQRNCLTCHSAQYVSSQPPGSPRTYWEATVKKMQKPFGAMFPDQDVAPMVDYLSQTYGAERSQPPANGRPAVKARHSK